MTAPTLEGRLICVSRCADWIPHPFEPEYYAGAGWLTPPQSIVAGPREVDACLIGQTIDGTVLAFRGTQTPPDPSVLEDWLNDFNTIPVSASGFPGLIHSGFISALQTLWTPLAPLLPPPPGPIIVTGHSKGASVAQLAVWKLYISGYIIKSVVFAPARCGTSQFATVFNSSGLDSVRYECGNDIVPHLPPSRASFLDTLRSLPGYQTAGGPLDIFDYESVGILRYVTKSGSPVPNSPNLQAERNLNLALALIRGQIPIIVADHRIYCGSGLMNAVAPVGVC